MQDIRKETTNLDYERMRKDIVKIKNFNIY